MSNYMYEFTVKERGYADVDCTEGEMKKKIYVVNFLYPALHFSNCGWENVEYKVMETPSGHRTEFLVLWAEEIGSSGSRWINVTGNSLASIMCEMCENLW